MSFESKYQSWLDHQVDQPPEYVHKVLQIWHEEGALGEDDWLLTYFWWNQREHKMEMKEIV